MVDYRLAAVLEPNISEPTEGGWREDAALWVTPTIVKSKFKLQTFQVFVRYCKLSLELFNKHNWWWSIYRVAIISLWTLCKKCPECLFTPKSNSWILPCWQRLFTLAPPTIVWLSNTKLQKKPIWKQEQWCGEWGSVYKTIFN